MGCQEEATAEKPFVQFSVVVIYGLYKSLRTLTREDGSGKEDNLLKAGVIKFIAGYLFRSLSSAQIPCSQILLKA